MLIPHTAVVAAVRLRALDDKLALKDNSLAVTFSGGFGQAKAREVLSDLRLLLRVVLEDERAPFGDDAA